MAKEKKAKEPFISFDEIVFEKRNKEYGAYKLRKKYTGTLSLGILIAVILLSSAVIIPYLNAKITQANKQVKKERVVEIQMENLDQPTEQVAAPPPPPPPPAEEVVAQTKYVPPVVVDSVKPEEEVQFMTADELSVEITDTEVGEEVVEVQEVVTEEIEEEEEEIEPFIRVEEMPEFPGGEMALIKYIHEHIIYPEVAKENNIQGKLTVQFCVKANGSIGEIRILRGVDPELDAEAKRVISELPAFKPGKQGGKAVPVWYTVPINFQLR